jgi:hypothetical protein
MARRQTYVVFDGDRVLGGVDHDHADRLARTGAYVATTSHVRADRAHAPMFEVRRPTWRARWVLVTHEMACWADAHSYRIRDAGPRAQRAA